MSRRRGFHVGPRAPGWVVRALLVLVAAVSAWGLAAPVGWWIAITVLAALGAVLPQTAGAWIAASGLCLILLFLPPDHARAAVAVASVHAIHVLASLSFVVGMRTIVSLRALLPSVRRYLGVQVVAQLLLAAAMLVPAGGGLAWAAVVGAIAVLALAVGLVLEAQRARIVMRVHRRSRASVGGPS